MGSVLEEVRLDYKPQFEPRIISDLIKEVSMIGDVNERVFKLDVFVKRLEDELRKIDAFKRELPLCMLLVKDAILFLKEESMKLQCVASTKNQQPVLEEFIPLKRSGDDHDHDHSESCLIKNDKDFRDKKSWLSSVQLWNGDDHSSKDSVFEQKLEPKVKKNKNQIENGDAFWHSKGRSEAMATATAAVPFEACLPRKEDDPSEHLSGPGLSLLMPGVKNSKEQSGFTGFIISCSRGVSSSAVNPELNLRNGSQPSQQQTSRKQRRCWSPELHRRFVDALERLGGSQAATPKQIRELMQVDGLTNDEVKSHLQKFRLHTRRMPNSTANPAKQSVVLGGLLQDQYGDSAKPTSSESGSPEGPLQLAVYTGGTSTTGGDSIEDEEDAKSEGYSWKGHIHRPNKDDV